MAPHINTKIYIIKIPTSSNSEEVCLNICHTHTSNRSCHTFLAIALFRDSSCPDIDSRSNMKNTSARGIPGTRTYIMVQCCRSHAAWRKVRQSCGEVGTTVRWLGIRGSASRAKDAARSFPPDGEFRESFECPEMSFMNATRNFNRFVCGEICTPPLTRRIAFGEKTRGGTQDAPWMRRNVPSSVNFPPEGCVMLVQPLLLVVSELGDWKLGRTFIISCSRRKITGR